MIPLSIPAECKNCGRVFIHVRGQSSHVCEVCGGPVSCGHPDCEPQTIGQRIKEEEAARRRDQTIASDDTVPLE